MEGKESSPNQLINRQEAVEILNDGGEHKFFIGAKMDTPVYIVGKSREKQTFNRLHEHIADDLNELKIINLEDVRGGYCKVENGKLLYWGESSYPVEAANEKSFKDSVDKNGIMIIDQWLGRKPEK
jgi:hypothetical protein